MLWTKCCCIDILRSLSALPIVQSFYDLRTYTWFFMHLGFVCAILYVSLCQKAMPDEDLWRIMSITEDTDKVSYIIFYRKK